jgi:hypothetical protein
MKTPELKPCPFCGSAGTIHVTEYDMEYTGNQKEIPKGSRFIRATTYPDGHTCFEYRRKAYVPQCSRTECIGRVRKLFKTEKEAVEAWNRRVKDENA